MMNGGYFIWGAWFKMGIEALMRIALAQINPTVGDLAGNLRKHLDALARARDAGAQVVVFPEMSILGYPPKDLLLKPAVIALAAQAVQRVAEAAAKCGGAGGAGITALVGYPEKNTASVGRPLHNAVAIVRDGAVVARRYKSLLPTYDVFDESRYFEPGGEAVGGAEEGGGGNTELTLIENQPIGVSICEDLWNDEKFVERPLYHFNPIGALAQAGAKMLLNISASPFVLGKNEYRHKLFSFQARRWRMPIVYVNQVGGNDELVFDGNSVVFDHAGEVIAQARDFEEDLLVADLPPDQSKIKIL
jgi:predicted amidohydrolase